MRNNFKIGDKLKVAKISSGNIEAELQSSDADDEVLEWNSYTFAALLALDLSDHPGSFDGDGMHWYVAAQSFDKSQTTTSINVRLCPIGAVDQFGDANN